MYDWKIATNDMAKREIKFSLVAPAIVDMGALTLFVFGK